MRFLDSHCHLDDRRYQADLPEVLERAQLAGVTTMLTCGTSLASSAECTELAAQHPALYATVGVHPHEAEKVAADGESLAYALSELTRLAKQPRVVAIGEIGLDYHYDFARHETQHVLLSALSALAVELDLPVVLHNRESDDDMMHILDDVPHIRGVLHCFSGSQKLLDWALTHGFYIGVAGTVTFKNAELLRSMLGAVPHEHILIETDAPYLAPLGWRGKRNEPAWVVEIAAMLGRLHGLSVGEVGEITYANAVRCFGLCDGH
ncbi:MAG: TatD family hydrolase [Chloroflexi bacterium]|nr:TatD family hydrolase [Chloroflexota bacterium]